MSLTKFRKYSFPILFLLFFFSSSLLWAQEDSIEEEKEPIVCHGDKVEFLEAENRMEASGNVIVIYEDVKITCDKIDIALDTKEGLAEGDVVIYQKDSILTGDKVEYNFQTQAGIVHKSGFASELIYGKGPQALKEGPKEITMHKGYMTTCDLAHPHYRVNARTAKIFLEDKVVMRHVIVYIFDVPVLYMPYYSYNLRPDRPKVTILPGKDNDWGYYLLTAWRYEFSQYIKGILRLDYREKRDFASGFDNYYKTRGYGNGFLKVYYMNERKLESKKLWSEPRITQERERYLIHNRHSWDIDENTDLRFEYWNVSDTDILKDYFYRKEYERGPTPESYLSIIRSWSNFSTSFLTKKRVNKVFERVEYLPELKFDVSSLRIGPKGSKYYWTSNNSFANLGKKEAYPSDVDGDAVRLDSFNQISRASKLGFLHITPYVGERQTYYTKDKYGDNDCWRGAFYTGVDVETKFYKVFNVQTNKLGLDINNLRHVITPSVGYDYIHSPTMDSQKVTQFDNLDGISRLNQITLSLENKLQTKRSVGPETTELQSVDLARFTVSTSYDYRLPAGSKFSDIDFDFEFTPFNWLILEFDSAYDHLQDKFTTFNLDIYAQREDKWKCGFGYRYARDSHSGVTFETSFKPTPLWKLGVYQRLMLRGIVDGRKKVNDLRIQEYRLVRDLHCWTAEVIYNVSQGEGESLYFVFRMKAFPETPFEFETSYHRPKEGSQNSVK